jgi:hypothetical protein
MPLKGLFQLVELLDHDEREVDGKREHVYACRRCSIERGLNQLKTDLRRTLERIDESIGESSNPSLR